MYKFSWHNVTRLLTMTHEITPCTFIRLGVMSDGGGGGEGGERREEGER